MAVNTYQVAAVPFAGSSRFDSLLLCALVWCSSQLKTQFILRRMMGLSYNYNCSNLAEYISTGKSLAQLVLSVTSGFNMTVASLSPRNSTSAVGDGPMRQELLLLVGPILFGTLINWLLLGVLTMQSYVYYFCFQKDFFWIKFSTYGLYLLEIVQTVLVTGIAWRDLCAGWGIPSVFAQNDWGFSMTPLAGGIIACWVQIFFAWRVCALGQNTFWKSIGLVIVVVSFTQGCASVILGVRLSFVKLLTDSEGLVEIQNLFFCYLTASMIADVLIAASLLYFFILTRRTTAWNRQTNRRITKLIRSTFETGTLCAVVAFLDLVIYLRDGHNHIHICIVMVLPKLYSNALVASLNSRAGVYERPTIFNSQGESRAAFNTVQFTSVGIPVTPGGFEREGKNNEQGAESEYVKTGRVRPILTRV